MEDPLVVPINRRNFQNQKNAQLRKLDMYNPGFRPQARQEAVQAPSGKPPAPWETGRGH